VLAPARRHRLLAKEDHMRIVRPLVPIALALVLGACGIGNDQPSLRGFALSWRMTDAAQPDPMTAPSLTCAQAAVATVSLDALDRNTNVTNHFIFDCNNMTAETPAVAESNYEIFLVAHASDGTARSQVRFDADNFSDPDADLGLTIFTVNLK
jgi:hypothetical protein